MPDRRRPLHVNLRIIPAYRALVLRGVEVSALVEKIDLVAEGNVAVREARRHPQHMMIHVIEYRADPLTEARRAAANVNRDIEHLTTCHAHQLALRLLDLIVQTAQRVAHG